VISLVVGRTGRLQSSGEWPIQVRSYVLLTRLASVVELNIRNTVPAIALVQVAGVLE